MSNQYINLVFACTIGIFQLRCESAEMKGVRTDYEFSLLKRDGYASVFRIQNKGKAPLSFPISLPARDNGINPSYVHYQFLKGGQWHEISNYFHGGAYEYLLHPKRSLSISIGLNHFQNVKSGTKVRILWGEYPSKSFRWSNNETRR